MLGLVLVDAIDATVHVYVSYSYCILLGTEWIEFKSQEEALAQKEPLEVFKISRARAWQKESLRMFHWGTVGI